MSPTRLCLSPCISRCPSYIQSSDKPPATQYVLRWPLGTQGPWCAIHDLRAVTQQIDIERRGGWSAETLARVPPAAISSVRRVVGKRPSSPRPGLPSTPELADTCCSSRLAPLIRRFLTSLDQAASAPAISVAGTPSVFQALKSAITEVRVRRTSRRRRGRCTPRRSGQSHPVAATTGGHFSSIRTGFHCPGIAHSRASHRSWCP